MARVVSINVSRGGVPKTAVLEARVSADGLPGDGHTYRLHGGPDRAVVLYSLELIAALQAEGHPIDIGTIGENLTLSGIDWAQAVPGAVMEVGAVELEITKFTTPCNSIRGSFLEGDISRVGQQARPGWSRVCARVLREGTVRVGDAVRLSASSRT